MASVLILNQYFPPDPVPTARHVRGLAERLAADGDEVTALVGQPSYVTGQPRSPEAERNAGVDVVRLGLGRRTGRTRMSSRLLGYARYLTGSWWRSRRLDPDVVICFHNPPVVALVGRAVARRTGARMLYVVQDIHPDIVVATGWPRLPKPVIRLWERVGRRMLSSADRVVVLGQGMKQTLLAKGLPPERIEVLPPWPDPELEPRPRDSAWRREHGIGDEELLLLCAGNMGSMHPLDPLLDAAGALSDRPVRFLIVGGGVRRDHWVEEAQRRGIERMRFMNPLPDEEFLRLVAASDVCYVPLGLGMEHFAVPSRGYAYLSAGRGVIANMAPDADLVTTLDETGAGWSVSSGADLAELIDRLLADPAVVEAAGKRAREAFESQFRGSVVLDRYAALVKQLVRA